MEPPFLCIGEARGEAEDRIGSCFVGPAGVELLRLLHAARIIKLSAADHSDIDRFYTASLPEALDAIWHRHPEVFRTNVFQRHPPGNDLATFCGPKATALAGYPPLTKSKFVQRQLALELDRLCEEIQSNNPNLILCLGATALWALSGLTTISKFRGTTLLSTHTVADYKLLPTFHPAALFKGADAYANRPIIVADLLKARAEAAFPDLRRPDREIWIEPTLDDIRTFITDHIAGCGLLSVDIETSGNRITCIGFAPTAAAALVVPLDDPRAKSGSYWPTGADEIACWNLIRGILADPLVPKLFHNGLYDIAFLYRAYGIKVFGAIEDTMLLHHSLQPEMLKGLGFLGSLYTRERAWKHMRGKAETIKGDDE